MLNFPWQVLVLASALLNAISASISKYQMHRGSSFQAMVFKYVASAVWVTTAWMLRGAEWPKLWWLMVLYGAFGGINVAAYTAAMRHSLSKTVLTTPINRLLGIAWSAIVLGEYLLFDPDTRNGRLIILGILLIPAIFWLFYEKKEGIGRWNKLIWFYVILGSIFPVVTKLFLRGAESLTILMFFYWGGLTSAIVLSKARSGRIIVNKRFTIRSLIHGLLASVGVFLWFEVLAKATVTEATLLRLPMTISLTTLSGLLVYQERKNITRKKIVGIGVALALMVIVLSIRR